MKNTGVKLGDNFRLSVDGKRIEPDEAKRLAKLSLPQRIAARKGKKTGVRVVKRGTARECA